MAVLGELGCAMGTEVGYIGIDLQFRHHVESGSAGLVAAQVLVTQRKINQYTFSNLGVMMEARIKEDGRGRKSVANACEQPCAIERGMRILGGKWTGSILWHLKDGPVRFNDLSRMIGGASKKMIVERLRQLEARGLIAREVIDGGPITVEYSITPFGETALDCLDALRRWSEELPDKAFDDQAA